MSMKKNLKYLLLLSLLSFMACNGDEKIDSGMVQQDGEVLQLNVRVGDFAINDVSSIRATDSGSTGTFENGDRSAACPQAYRPRSRRVRKYPAGPPY